MTFIKEVRPLVDMGWALLRQVLPPLTVYAAAKGWLGEDELTLITALMAGIGVPLALGQHRTFRRAAQVRRAEEILGAGTIRRK